MDYNTVMQELEKLSTAQTQKNYRAQRIREPFFGVPTGAMKPLFKQIKRNQALAEQLYATGNYDAMYFAGMIANPKVMTAEDFERWIDAADCYQLSDFVVAVSLAETDFAQEVADRWIGSGEEPRMEAGWACYEWLLGTRKDSEFDRDKLLGMLQAVEQSIHSQPSRTRHNMNNFVVAVGVSYVPLHAEALETAKAIGTVQIEGAKGMCAAPAALEAIQKADARGQIGFKRKAVRC